VFQGYANNNKSVSMGRLYYEKPVNPLQPKAYSGEEGNVKHYLDKVSKLIPSEIIAGYLVMSGFVPLVHTRFDQRIVYFIIFLLCQILTPVYLNSQAESNKPKRNHLVISSVAFTVWAYVTTGKAVMPDYYDAALASIMLVAFSLVSAIVPLNK
jgi:hypothetical protein